MADSAKVARCAEMSFRLLRREYCTHEEVGTDGNSPESWYQTLIALIVIGCELEPWLAHRDTFPNILQTTSKMSKNARSLLNILERKAHLLPGPEFGRNLRSSIEGESLLLHKDDFDALRFVLAFLVCVCDFNSRCPSPTGWLMNLRGTAHWINNNIIIMMVI